MTTDTPTPRATNKPGKLRRISKAAICLALAAAFWLYTVHLHFCPAVSNYRQQDAVAPWAHDLASYQLGLWSDPEQLGATLDTMRISNAEWDFMGRTFLVLALCNMALHEPDQQAIYLDVVDRILDETIAAEAAYGQTHFLMPYATHGRYRNPSGRSLFVDGEIALMLAARQAVASKTRFEPILSNRIDAVVAQLEAGPTICSESYPNECWTFCNSAAIAAVVLSDYTDGRDHSALIQRWLRSVKTNLVDTTTGMLVSSFTYDGQPLDGPEGTSIYFVAHMLQLIDPAFAQAQYDTAKHELGDQFLGFGYAHEWPASWEGPADIDSGPIVPILDISTGASGMAVLGAAAFNDDQTLRSLMTMLEFAAFPVCVDGRRRYAASNQVGDAVLLYALVQGPLWERVRAESTAATHAIPIQKRPRDE